MGFKALSSRLPEWGRLFDEAGYDAFQDAVREELSARGPPFELHDGYARIGDWELPLLPLAQLCAQAPRSGWRPLLREQLERRFAEEKLGQELDSVRGNFDRARPALKLRVQRAETLRPGTISAPIAGHLHAALVLDLPSFVTPVRVADLAAWERPAPELIAIAIDNVKTPGTVPSRMPSTARKERHG